MSVRGIPWIVLLGSGLTACAYVELPYDYERIPVRKAPIHNQRMVVIPFADAREGDKSVDDAERSLYQGIEFVHTDLGDLRRSAGATIAEAIARHLARSKVFVQIILADRPEDAPEADLILRGSIKRARGYVEAEARKKSSKKPLDERTVLAEVVLSDVHILDAKTNQRLLDVDLGWSLLEERQVEPTPEPWTVLSQALSVSIDQLVLLLETADLSGRYQVVEKVSLPATATGTLSEPAPEGAFGRLDSEAPEGWQLQVSTKLSDPAGWKGQSQCIGARIVAQQTQRFHRVLGPYQPSVDLWACPKDLSLRLDWQVEFPAVYLGSRKDGAHYFGRALGESNWPRATDQIFEYLALRAPVARYIYEFSPNGHRAAVPSR